MKKYIITAPKLSNSNGVRVLYHLAEVLEENGYEAYIYAMPTEGDYKHKYISEITEEMRKNDIVVYPEIVYGNPLKFQNVVRWVLFYPGKLGGNKKYDSYEKIFAFDSEFISGCDELSFPTLDETLFYYDGTPKDVDCYFVHKGGKWRKIPEFDSMIEINMSYPETREELAKLLRRTKTLYSYDRNTLLINEAQKCNCIVKIVEKDGFSDYKGCYNRDNDKSDSLLQNFIKITQDMDYQGKIRGGNLIILLKNKFKYFLYKYILKNKAGEDKYKYKLW